jgi:integrase
VSLQRVVGLRGLLFHDLRRSVVRDMIRAGVSDKVAMQISGHRTAAMLWRYDITDMRDVVEAVRRTEKYLSDVQAGPLGRSQKRSRCGEK